LDSELTKIVEQGSDDIFIADSLEDLAYKTGINVKGLRRTIDEYNNACEIGVDEIFHKNSRYLRPVKSPKFYAYRMAVGGYGTLGGIKINHRTEVMKKNGDIIPGLYAAGNDVNTIYAGDYIYPLPGNTMGFALNTGRIAGENAAKYSLGLGNHH
jgi:fumarate reductase flavoprotein subunit